MSKRRVAKKTGKVRRQKTGEQAAVWNALQVTGQLIGHLKNAQLSYLRVGVYLAKVRDGKLFAVLKHPDLEDYAEKRLGLSRSSLYRYLRIHDWVATNKPEWLQPKPKGRIPDLSDISDAIRIGDVLEQNPRMTPAKRKGLEELRQNALTGNLSQGAVGRALKKGSKGAGVLRAFESRLRALRRQGGEISSVPPEVLKHLDAAIAMLRNEHAVAQAGLHLMSAHGESADVAIV